ncbi:MAG: ComF family protein [Dysgonamonadaceae bacterium]|jgi:ComF family protein|nr:ComF family protein [Dysgonamonadaceae bacterium]
MNLTNLLTSFFSLFYPNLCVICREPLLDGEEFLCLCCFINLPKTNYRHHANNRASDRFSGKIPVEKATSYLYYNKGGAGQKLVMDIKYKGNIYLGKWLGQLMAKELHKDDFFTGIDCLVPVPLHPHKLKKRGFNQAEIIAQGISSVTHIPLETKNLYRSEANVTQTRKNVYERWKNTSGIFRIKDKQMFEGKHVLIIDDVLTTGSTLESCAVSLLETVNIRISLLTIAIT